MEQPQQSSDSYKYSGNPPWTCRECGYRVYHDEPLSKCDFCGEGRLHHNVCLKEHEERCGRIFGPQQHIPIPVPGVANPDIKRPGAELEAAIADRADAENEAEEDKLTVEYGPIRLPPCGRRCNLRNIYVADFGAYAGRCVFPCRLRAHHTGACQCDQQHEVEEAAIAAAGSGELEFHVGE